MKKLLPVLLALMLVLSACGTVTPESDAAESQNAVNLVATTYPVYLFTQAVVQGAGDGVFRVELMIDQPVSCLHDYTLSVSDMQTLEGADVILLSGAGLEETMADALSAVEGTPVIDCSDGVDTLPSPEDPQEADPHIWMDPVLACQMVDNIANGLAALYPDQADAFARGAQEATAQIAAGYEELKPRLAGLSCRELITFHDGFQYFARAFDLTVLRSIEEEAGSEASAKEVGEIISDVETHGLPAVFTEVNGSSATAGMIARETGVSVAALDLIMSRDHGDGAGAAAYLARLAGNITAIEGAYS